MCFFAEGRSSRSANIALALAKGARNMGVQIFENIKVEDVIINDDHAKGVQYFENGEPETIFSDVVVNCGGMG